MPAVPCFHRRIVGSAGGASSVGGATGVLDPPRTRTLPTTRRERRDFDGFGPPPRDPGDGSRGGDGRDDEPWGENERPPQGSAELALGFALAAISTLFLILLGVWLLMRRGGDPSPTAGMPAPPRALWLSTVVLLASSFALVRASRADRLGARAALLRWFTVSCALGLSFLVAQAFLWRALVRAGLLPSSNSYGMIFYALTGLHALHVAIGLGYMGWLYGRLRAMDETTSSLRLCSIYWHFMGGLWIVLFLVLYFAP
jgi:cytochrome c oxidase subunit 3